MRIAVLSDIHSNLHALQAVFKDIDRQGIDQVYCLGDVIGYAAFPGECLELLGADPRFKGSVQGNHEDGVLVLAEKKPALGPPMSDDARFALVYSYGQLSKINIEMISAWPEICQPKGLGITFAHGAASSCRIWRYTVDVDNVRYESKNSPTRITFLGHTHRPYFFSGRNDRFLKPDDWHFLSASHNYVINPGSVGQPRDGNTKAAYGILEVESGKTRYKLRRVRYDIASARKAIRAANLPERLAWRLELGR